MQVLEKHIEQAFVRKVRAACGQAIKLNTVGPYGRSGWPDRLVLLPHGRVCFVELKRDEKEEPTPLQRARQDELTSLGFSVGTFSDADRAYQWADAVTRLERAR